MTDKLTIGRKVVYPTHGVVEVQKIEEKEIYGIKESFYILKTVGSNMTLMVPTDNASKVGLRPIISKKEVPKILKILGKKSKNNHTHGGGGQQSWNKRYKEYNEKLKSGDIFEIAEVFQKIHGIRKSKSLSFGEKKLMDNAFKLLITELATAKGETEEIIADKVEKLLDSSVN